MKVLTLSLLLLLAATISQARPSVTTKVIELLTSNNIVEKEADLLAKERLSINYTNCRSWHLGVETSNIIKFKTVPANCEEYVKDYLTGPAQQYRADSKTVCKEAYFYAKGLSLKNDTINVWIFDLDETLLSSIPFNAEYGYGTKKVPNEAFWEWQANGGTLPGLPESLHLYENLLELGIEPIIVTDRWEKRKEITLKSLKAAGFTNWKHILFMPNGSKTKVSTYKSKVRKNLVKLGYNIIGNIGDQWADLVEDTPGRAFKLPNPLYYQA